MCQKDSKGATKKKENWQSHCYAARKGVSRAPTCSSLIDGAATGGIFSRDMSSKGSISENELSPRAWTFFLEKGAAEHGKKVGAAMVTLWFFPGLRNFYGAEIWTQNHPPCFFWKKVLNRGRQSFGGLVTLKTSLRKCLKIVIIFGSPSSVFLSQTTCNSEDENDLVGAELNARSLQTLTSIRHFITSQLPISTSPAMASFSIPPLMAGAMESSWSNHRSLALERPKNSENLGILR